MKPQLWLLVFLLFSCQVGFAQTDEISQLKAQLSSSADSLHHTDALNKISLLYFERNMDSMRAYAIKARDIAHRLNYRKGEADAANNLGIFDEIKGNAQEAFRYYLDAFNRYSAIGDTPNQVQTTMNIAIMYHETEKPAKSLAGFRQAFALGSGIKSDSIMATLYANYASCFSDQLSEDSISYYITKAKEIATRYQDKTALLFIDVLQAENLAKNRKTEEAVHLLQSTLQAARHDSLFYTTTGILIDLGNIVSDSAIADDYYLQALALAQAKGFRSNVRFAYEKLYDFYQSRDNDSASLVYSEKLLVFYDEQKNIDNNSGIDYIDYALMNKSLSQSLITSRYRQRMLWLTITICVLFFVLIVMLWRNSRKMKKTTAILKTQYAQSELSMEALDRLNKNYARVIKVVAHDLRNPLSSISMISDMMAPHKMTAHEMEKFVTIIRTTTKGCFDLIEELLQTDIDEELHLEKAEVSLSELLLQCVRLLGFKAREKGQEIILTNNLHIMFVADGDKIIRVISNLVVNAIKFSPEGRPIHIKTFPAGNNVVITVTDEGIGIPEALASRIFDPFTSAKRKGTKGENTFGLGLYISKQIVEAHGGSIWFKSSPEGGTTFYVELPLHTKSGQSLSFSTTEEKQKEA